jgi:hypothetical protein
MMALADKDGQTMWRRALVTALLASFVAVAATASAETPIAADLAACNAAARAAVETGTAIPTTKDYMHAEAARRGRAATVRSVDWGTDVVPYSSDPQLVGMETEGTTDAAYQAAYRTCMRRRGF